MEHSEKFAGWEKHVVPEPSTHNINFVVE